MSRNYNERPNGYLETIRNGLDGVRGFRDGLSIGIGTRTEQIERLKTELKTADAIVIGAGAGLSTSAGFVYSGERFRYWFSDFAERFGIKDMYSGGFYPFPDEEIYWAWWSRHIYCNRYAKAPKPVYENLLKLVADRDYFVITTNVDHMFQKAGFDKKRLFYTQGDYGLFQCSRPCCKKTWENESMIREMVLAQGFVIGERNDLTLPESTSAAMRIPTDLVPRCPSCGRPLTMNLRSDDRFVEDEGWQKAAVEYEVWLTSHRDQQVVFLEIGVGFNTPGIIKYPFRQQVYQNKKAVYASLNMEKEPVPEEIRDRSILIAGDAHRMIQELLT